jgi:uncharacterized protein
MDRNDPIRPSRRRCARWCLALTVAAIGVPLARAADDPVKTVYHVTDTENQVPLALNNARNQLRADPTARIVVVALFKGIQFLVDGAADRNGNPFRPAVEDLMAQGVEFRICRNSMEAFKVDPAKVIPEVKIVPSGVAEIARLQAREGYVYVKP